jgi:hypothetical protein
MTADPPSCPCGGHELRTVAEIGDWIHGIPESPTVRDWAARSIIWTEGRCELPHDDLRSRIEIAGGITCEHALEAHAPADGVPHLINGIHRWAVAHELEITTIPVQVVYDRQESESAWAL